MKQSWYISAYALFLIFVITRVNIVNSNETLNIVGSKFFQNTKQSILDKTHNKENRSNVFTNQIYLPDVKNTLLFRKADSVTDKTKVANKNTEEIKVTDSHVTQDPKNQSSNSISANTNKLNSNSKTNNDSNSNKVFIDANNKDNKSQAQTRVAYGGFFDTLSKNSKENENMAWKALATFLGGIACFFISIHVTCWNERRAVKEVEFTDWISKAERCGIISNGVETEKIESSKSYIVSGELQLQQTARIPDLNIDFTYGANRHAIIKYEVEHFTIYDSSVTETNSDGESYNRPVTTKQWAPYFEGQNEKLKTRILTGTGLISGKYKVNLEKLSHLVESHQTRDIADNKYIHVFKQSDEQLLLDYFKKDSNTDLEIKVIVDNQYAYIIRKDASKINRDSFKSSTYDFSVEDRRIKIKYVSLVI